MSERKSIKIDQSTDDILLEIKKKYNLHSRDEAIKYMRGNLKTTKELLDDDLKPLKEHLIEIGRPDIYDKVYELIHPLTIDERFAKAVETLKLWRTVGTLTNNDVKRAFNQNGIEKHEHDKFKSKLREVLI